MQLFYLTEKLSNNLGKNRLLGRMNQLLVELFHDIVESNEMMCYLNNHFPVLESVLKKNNLRLISHCIIF